MQAVARVYGTGTVRQIEEVEVVEAHRGAGLGRAVVLASLHHALRADPELVFVVADAADWPWRWYQRLGFRPVGRTGGFDRDV